MNRAQEIEKRAAEWLVRRDANGAVDQAEFTAWLASDPRHRAAYLRLAAAWARTAHLRRLRPEGDAIDPDLLSRRREIIGWRQLSLAVAPMAIAVLSLVWWAVRWSETQTYRTVIGGMSRVVLADGTTVTLNTDTELKVRLRSNRREIVLEHGEAQFVVAHDVARPFEVSAGGRIVRAVGTAFDVRWEPESELEVIVTEGRVAVIPSTGAVHAVTRNEERVAMVSAGEGATENGRQLSIHAINASEASRRLAWQTGELSFQGETLGEAIAEFNRYNHRRLKVQDPAIAKLQIGGNFQVLDVDSFVDAVQRSFDLTVEVTDDGSVVFERRGDAVMKR
jgi:transmembrane sensor